MSSMRLTRKPERAGDRPLLDELLDEVLAGTLSTVVEGLPWVVPMLFARDGNRILLHGSTGAGALRQVAAGAPAALSVMSIDGLVVAESTFNSSANYRSAVIQGQLRNLDGEEKWTALDTISDRLIPGRVSEIRPMTGKETAATMAMELPIIDGQWVVKARVGGVSSDEPSPAWTGVIPLRQVALAPEPSPASADQPLPQSVTDFVARRSMP